MSSHFDRLPSEIQDNINELATIRKNYDRVVRFLKHFFVWECYELKTLQPGYFLQKSRSYMINPSVLLIPNLEDTPDITEYFYIESEYTVAYFQYGNNTLEVKKGIFHCSLEDKPDGAIHYNEHVLESNLQRNGAVF